MIKRLLLFPIGFFSALLLVEFLQNRLIFTTPFLHFECVADPALGWHYKPGSLFTWPVEGHNRGHINAEGFYDVNHSLTRKPGSLRIVLMGDSYLEAMGIPRASALPGLLEKELSMRTGRAVEVLSYGLSGWGTVAERFAFANYVSRYSPDAVVLLMSFNDYLDNINAPTGPVARWDRGQLTYHQVPDAIWNAPPGMRISYRVLWETTRDTRNALRTVWQDWRRRLTLPISNAQALTPVSGQPTSATVTFRRSSVSVDPVAMRDPSLVCRPAFYAANHAFYEGCLDTLGAVIDDFHRILNPQTTLVVVRLPYPFELYDGLNPDGALSAQGWRERQHDLFSARKNTLFYYDFTDALRMKAQESQQPLNFNSGEGHLNQRGHQVVAAELATHLADVLHLPH